ncbi:MAG: hypothetical protein QOE57_3665, partial [Acidimicrobiaceae bacterium]|nr:hypothetical protein [Acidimicrobiaceae bacterium]
MLGQETSEGVLARTGTSSTCRLANDTASTSTNQSHPGHQRRPMNPACSKIVSSNTPQDHGPPIPELVRRLLVTSCHVDPPPALVKTLQRLHRSGVTIGDVQADTGYAHRHAAHRAQPLRAQGAAHL